MAIFFNYIALEWKEFRQTVNRETRIDISKECNFVSNDFCGFELSKYCCNLHKIIQTWRPLIALPFIIDNVQKRSINCKHFGFTGKNFYERYLKHSICMSMASKFTKKSSVLETFENFFIEMLSCSTYSAYVGKLLTEKYAFLFLNAFLSMKYTLLCTNC